MVIATTTTWARMTIMNDECFLFSNCEEDVRRCPRCQWLPTAAPHSIALVAALPLTPPISVIVLPRRGRVGALRNQVPLRLFDGSLVKELDGVHRVSDCEAKRVSDCGWPLTNLQLASS